MKPERTDSWRCACCGRTYQDKRLAEACCVCHSCGKVAGEGKMTCDDCEAAALEKWREEKYARACKVAWDAYDGACVYVSGTDGGYLWDWSPQEVADYWESCNEGAFPGFGKVRVWGARAEPVALDPTELEGMLYDCAFEDYEIDEGARADLVKLCESWNRAHAETGYWPDESVAVVYEGHIPGSC